MTELTLDAIYEMRGTGRLRTDSLEQPRYVELEPTHGILNVKEGVYRVTFNEEVELEEGEVGIIRSSGGLMSIGAFLLPRRVGVGERDGLQTTLVAARAVEIEPNSQLGALSIDNSLKPDNVEEYVDEKMDSLAQYLEFDGVENVP